MTARNSGTATLFTASKADFGATASGILFGPDAGGNAGIEIIGSTTTSLGYIDFGAPDTDYNSRILSNLANGTLTFYAGQFNTALEITGGTLQSKFYGLIEALNGLTISSGKVLTNNGTSTFAGSITANGGITIASGQTLTNNGTTVCQGVLSANGGITIASGQTLTNSGT